MKKILIMAGGTGGHVFPALAVAAELQQKDIEVHWLGTQKGIESNLVPKAGYPLHYIRVNGLVGTGFKRKLFMPFMLLRAIFQALIVMIKVKPNAVLGMGGFAAGPGGVAAYLTARPLLIHEQNAVAGLTNKYLSKLSKIVLTGFRDAKSLSSKAVWVGNPVRKEIAAMKSNPKCNEQKSAEQRKILILGGSQGANSLNKLLPEVLQKIAEDFDLDVWHQSGKDKKEMVDALYKKATDIQSVNVTEFIDDMASAYQWPDLIICRAGAMTVSEIMAAGKAAIFLPYPFAAGNHQELNAQFMVDAGASLLSKDDAITSDAFLSDITQLLKRLDVLKKMGEAAALMHRENAAKTTSNYCLELMNA